MIDIPLLIPSLDLLSSRKAHNFRVNHHDDNDIGGYLREVHPFPSWKTFSNKVNNQIRIPNNDTYIPDYGNLIIFERDILREEWTDLDGYVLNHPKNNPNNTKLLDIDLDYEDSSGCRHTNWEDMYHPNCNSFHEISISRNWDPVNVNLRDEIQFQNIEIEYFSNGYYRDAWIVDHKLSFFSHNTTTNNSSTTTTTSISFYDPIILKTLRYEHNVTKQTFSNVQKDALVMERLSSSPRIVNIFGHCSTSVTVQFIQEEVEEIIVPGNGMISSSQQQQQLQPRNHYTPTQKLNIALQMAQSIADLHGFDDGVIVHDDIQLCQWLRQPHNGNFILGDFNRAHIMKYNPHTNQYCKYHNGMGYGNYRSPEEFAGADLDEKIDVFSLGNNIYALLTGLWVFYENDDDEVVQKKIIKGDLAFVDDRYRNSSFAEGKLVEIMEKCWAYESKDRVDVFEVVAFLQNAVQQNQEFESNK